MRVESSNQGQESTNNVDTDAAMAADALFKKLEYGYYEDGAKRRKIQGDFTKLMFAESLSAL